MGLSKYFGRFLLQVSIQIQICEELNICGLLDSHISKNEFKNRIRKACDEANQKEIYQQIQTYKKMTALRDEIRKGNSYFFTETL